MNRCCDKCKMAGLHESRLGGLVHCTDYLCECHHPIPITDVDSIVSEFEEKFRGEYHSSVIDWLHTKLTHLLTQEQEKGADIAAKWYQDGVEEGIAQEKAKHEISSLTGEDGKLFSKVVAKAFEAPFPEVAVQHAIQKVHERALKIGTDTEKAKRDEMVEKIEALFGQRVEYITRDGKKGKSKHRV